MKHVLRLFAFFLFSQSAIASHLLGGEITWECDKTVGQTNSGKFRFKVVLYRECGGTSLDGVTTVYLGSNSPVSQITCPRVSQTNVSPTCNSGQLSCSGAPSGAGHMEEHVYLSSWITINGTPGHPSNPGNLTPWTFYVIQGSPNNSLAYNARPGTLANGTSTDYYLRAVMYGAPNSNGIFQASSPCFDSSPQFAEKPISIICPGYDYTYTHNAFDPDVDSVFYEWSQPMAGPSTPSNFTNGYSATNPFPGLLGFNQVSGLVTLNSSISGSFMSCQKVTSYRCNKIISEVYRDVALVIKSNCETVYDLSGGTPTPVLNAPPNLLLDSIPPMAPGVVFPTKVYSGYGVDTVYIATVYPGDSIAFRLTAIDGQAAPTTYNSQNVSFSIKSSQVFNSVLPNSCVNPPCAKVTSLSGSFTSPSSLNVDFGWRISCNHLTNYNSCGIGSNSYVFPLKMSDDACPAPGISVATLIVNVLPSIPSEPLVNDACVAYDDVNNLINISWQEPIDIGQEFKGYIVFHGNSSSSPFVAIDTVWSNVSSTFYQHTFNNPRPNNSLWRAPFTSGGNLTSNYYYFRTIGSCDYQSVNSDTIRLIELSVTGLSQSLAQLNWNAHSTGASPLYEVWRRQQGSGPSGWTQLGITANRTFIDTVNVCGQNLDYQIRINGVCNSTIDGGSFEDGTDPLPPIIDSVTVDGNSTYISWQASPSLDAVMHIIYEELNNGVFPVDSFNVLPLMPVKINTSTPTSLIQKFTVVAKDSCNNQGSELFVSAHNNILLKENMDPCEGYMRLRWNSYKGWPDGVQEYQIWRTQTPLVGGTSQDQLIATNNPLDTFFVDRSLMGGFSYCYKIRAVDGSLTKSSTSNSVCINSLAVQRSRVLYLAKTSVRNDNTVELVTFIDKEADVKHFDLQRADRKGAPFESLGLIPKPVASGEIRFKDFSAAPNNHRYQYRFVATDSCGGIDTASNIGTNILLEVQPVDNLTNILTWNPYRDFKGGVLSYDIYRSVGENGGMSFVGTTTDTIFTDNIRPLGDNVGIFCYKVVATEGPSPFNFEDYDGSVFTSTSNFACGGEHKARIFIPNSFSPESDFPENQTWKPKHVYVEDASYSLEIFDRWGVKVFSTRDISIGWDGTIDGTQAAEGSYIYQLNYRSKQGEPVNLRGTLLLIY